MTGTAWEARKHSENGKTYFQNVVTGVTLWHLPDNKWTKVFDRAQNRWYYQNLRLHQVSLAEPLGYHETTSIKTNYNVYGNEMVSAGVGGDVVLAGFVPLWDATCNRAFWYDQRQAVWERPPLSRYPFGDDGKDTSSNKEQEARYLQFKIQQAQDDYTKLEKFTAQMKTTATARARHLGTLRGKTKGGRTSAPRKAAKAVGRYLENSFAGVSNRRSVKPKVKIETFLKSVPLFSALDEAEFAYLTRVLEHKKYANNQVIISQESIETDNDHLYLIESGIVQVFKSENAPSFNDLNTFAAESSYGRLVNQLTEGDYFGERALLSAKKLRSATVVAVGEVRCYLLHSSSFEKLTKKIDQTPQAKEYSNLDVSHIEVSTLTKHISNFEYVLSLRRKTAGTPEAHVADALINLMTAFSPELSVSDTIRRMTNTLYKIFGCERIGLYYANWDDMELELQPSPDFNNEPLTVKIGQGVVGYCAERCKMVNIPHVNKSFFSDQFEKLGAEINCTIRNVLCCPVMNDDDVVVAVVQLINKKGGAAFSEQDEHVFVSVVEQMAGTLDMRKMEKEIVQHQIPLRSVLNKVRVKLKRFYGTSLPGELMSSSVVIGVCIWYAGQPLCDEQFIERQATTLNPLMIVDYNDNVTLNIQYKNLPRTARLIFTAYYGRSFKDVDLDLVSHESLQSSWTSSFNSKYVNEESNSKRGRAKGSSYNSSPPDFTNETNLIPIGWTGCLLFDFDQKLRSNKLRLKLYPGACTPDLAAVTPVLDNPEIHEVDRIDLEFPYLDSNLGKLRYLDGTEKEAVHPPVVYTDDSPEELGSKGGLETVTQRLWQLCEETVKKIVPQDPLNDLTEDEKSVMRQVYPKLTTDQHALGWYLQSVQWNKRSAVQNAYRILHQWKQPDPTTALRLLNYNFPDPKVRAFAVSALEHLTDVELEFYMLQLTQVLKFERFLDSALSRFLLRRALEFPDTTGHKFFWYLKAEMKSKNVKEKFGTLLDLFLRYCRPEMRAKLGHEMFVMNKLDALSAKVSLQKPASRSAYLKEELQKVLLPNVFQLPLDFGIKLEGINTKKCRVMNSKKAPLWIEWMPVESKNNLMVLFKRGDDLRQDQLTLQLLRVMDNLWKDHDLDMCMTLYGCISTGKDQGLIEVVSKAETIAKITAGSGKTKLTKAARVFNKHKLKKWLRNKSPNGNHAEKNFMHSCAAYCVATYVLGIGDRHNDNIMLSEDGKLFHIDFGHFLGNFKFKLGLKRERSPFVFTPAMADILGPLDKPLFKEFEVLCGKAFNILRKNANLLITLFSLMLSCGIPELETKEDIKWLREKLMPGATEEVAAETFRKLIHESIITRTTQFNDVAHLINVG